MSTYPSLLPPAQPYLNGADPLASGIQAKLAIGPSGEVYELISGRVGQSVPFAGGAYNFGRPPALVANVLPSGSPGNFPGLSFLVTSQTLQFGQVASTAAHAQRSYLAVFRVDSLGYAVGGVAMSNPPENTPAVGWMVASTPQSADSGGDDNCESLSVTYNSSNYNQVLLQVAGSSGAIAPSTPIPLTVGLTYAIGISYDPTTSPYPATFYVYCYDTQTLVVNAQVQDGGIVPSSAVGNLVLNCNNQSYRWTVSDATLYNGLITGSQFAAYYQDPWSASRGAAPASGAYAPGYAGMWQTTQTSVTINAGPTTGIGSGGNGVGAIQWYASQVGPLDTPGSGTCPALSGQTSRQLHLTGLAGSSTPTWYYAVGTDGTSTVNYTPVHCVPSRIADANLFLIGDSIMHTGWPWTIGLGAVAQGAYGAILNCAEGAQSITSFQPAASPSLLIPAVTQAGWEGISDCIIELTANDAALTDMTVEMPVILNYVLAHGISNVYFMVNVHRNLTTAASYQTYLQYFSYEATFTNWYPNACHQPQPVSQSYLNTRGYLMSDNLHPLWQYAFNQHAGQITHIAYQEYRNQLASPTAPRQYQVLGLGATYANMTLVEGTTYTVGVLLVGTAALQAFTATFGAISGLPWSNGGVVSIAQGSSYGSLTVTPSATGTFNPSVTHAGAPSIAFDQGMYPIVVVAASTVATAYTVQGIPGFPIVGVAYPVSVCPNGAVSASGTVTLGGAGITYSGGGVVALASGATIGTLTATFASPGNYQPTASHAGLGFSGDPTLNAAVAVNAVSPGSGGGRVVLPRNFNGGFAS